MNCPICKEELEIKKKKVGVDEEGNAIYNEFAICHACKKQWNLDKKRAKKSAAAKSEKPASKAAAKPATKTAKPVEKPAAKPAKRSVNEEADSRPKKKHKKITIDEEHVSQYYSNLPPENVRKKREKEMRENYDRLLEQAGPGDEDFEKGAYGGTILLIILLIAIIALGVYIYFRFFM